MKRYLRFAALLCALLLLSACALAEDGPELLENGGFERVNGSGDATGWFQSAYRNQEGYTRFSITKEKAHSGQYSAKIVNANENDARYLCTVPVEPNAMYRVSGYVCVERMEDMGNGANLAVEGIYAFSECLYDTAGQWQYVEWYGETDEGQTSVQLGARVGGYGAESVGTAYFDDLSVVMVDTLPDGVIADLWYTPSYASAQSAEDDAETEPARSTLWFVAIAALYVLLAAVCLRGRTRAGGAGAATIAVVIGLLAALAARVAIACLVPGYSVDMNCFSSWSMRMANVGPAGFYAEDYFCDYPPGMMLLLWPTGALLNAVGYSNTGVSWLIVKLLPILADIALSAVLFACLRKRLNAWEAALITLLYAFNPAAIVNGAAWGQVDAVLALLIALTALLAMEKRWRAAIPLLIVSALVKPQALLFAPIGAVWLILSLVLEKGKERVRQGLLALQGLGVGVACAAAIILPFSLRQSDPLWLVRLYQETLSSYHYASLNTANLAYLLGGNWSALDTGARTLPFALPLLTGLALAAPGVWRLCAPRKNKREWRALAPCALCAVLGLAFLIEALFPCTYMSYGVTWMIGAYLAGAAALIVRPEAKRLPYCLAMTLIGVYVLGIKIHERYLFCALALLLIGYAATRDRRMLWLCVGFSATTFINTAIVLDNSILFGAVNGHLTADTLGLNDALCAANLLLCGWAAYIGFTEPRAAESDALEQAPEPARPSAAAASLLAPRDARLRLERRDWLIMLITAAVYAVVTFVNLGSTKAPQTGWVSTSKDEQIVLELQERQTFSVAYFGEVNYGNFSVSVSDDGIVWSEPIPCDMREALCFRWVYANASTTENGVTTFRTESPDSVLWLTGRYLRVNAERAGLKLNELILHNQNGDVLPLALVSHTGAKDELGVNKPAENLIDEQDTMQGEPSWFNGTYFDEIYFARTAYEHLHGLTPPLEYTHPPLGKLMIAACVAVFGMTPFGWRFAGALIGVLMLPALYLLAKQLTRRRDLATFSMLLLAFDLLHFTQTRIATIDSFPVFFIILSYLCMARYLMADPVPSDGRAEKPRLMTRAFLRSLIPLALCGLFMGLGIACKWIGIYSAVGLAILFLVATVRRLLAGNAAFAIEIGEGSTLTDAQKGRVRDARELTVKRMLVTCGFCVLFFIVVPLVIYYLSYIPFLAPSGPVTIQRVIDEQVRIFRYHSTPGLGDDHPFNSPWWQWPFILKPIWYVQDKFEPAGYASTIMCMGNPAVFYVGAVCMALCILLCVRKYLSIARGRLSLRHGDGDLTLPMLVIGFLTQYLPWVLVPRSMYFYHYFASVPFIILATAVVFGLVPETKPKLRHGLMIGFVLVAAAFFAMFYPYASGALTPVSWLEWLKWFPRIYY